MSLVVWPMGWGLIMYLKGQGHPFIFLSTGCRLTLWETTDWRKAEQASSMPLFGILVSRINHQRNITVQEHEGQRDGSVGKELASL